MLQEITTRNLNSFPTVWGGGGEGIYFVDSIIAQVENSQNFSFK